MLTIIKRLTAPLTILFCLIPVVGFPHHIAAADLNMQAISTANKNFRITLNIYIEDKNSPIAGANLEEGVVIFRKRDNAKMERLFLRRHVPPSFLVFQNPACAELNNLKIYHSIFYLDVFLDPGNYNDPEGYFIMFDRCCRSQELTNIKDPTNTALAVMLEFPSVKDVRNSSPSFSNLDGQFICKNEPFSANLMATDADGDKLVYSLADPYKGYASLDTNPYFDETPRATRPGVVWLNGYSKNNSIPGNPPLTIDPQTGIINVTANKVGIYVFAILCEEFRNGKRIGATRLDYFLKVVDCSSSTLPKPVLNFNNKEISSLTLCPGATILIETNDNADWAFQWKKNNINLPGANTNQFTVTEEGTYTVVKSSRTSCVKEAISAPLFATTPIDNSGIKIKRDFTPTCEGTDYILSLENPDQVAGWYANNVFIKQDKSLTVNKTGQYEARLTGTVLCPILSNADMVDLTFDSKPVIGAPQNSYLLCPGDAINLTTSQDAAYAYQWYLNKVSIPGANTNSYAADEVGNYTVKVRSLSCESESEIFKVVNQSGCTGAIDALYIPNVFTPNNDGKNDSWKISNIEKYPECEVLVFNRWGENIFYSKGYSVQWDGKTGGEKVNADTYTFIIRMGFYKLPDIKGTFVILY